MDRPRIQLTSEDYARLEELAYLGVPDVQIAAAWGMSQSWVRDKLRSDARFGAFYQSGVLRRHEELRRALLDAARGTSGDPDAGIQGRPPDVRALIFACQAMADMRTQHAVTNADGSAIGDPEAAAAIRLELEQKLGKIGDDEGDDDEV